MEHFDFIRNRAFDDRTYAFVPQTPQAEPGKPFWEFTPMDTGARVMENGDVQFGFFLGYSFVALFPQKFCLLR